MIKKVLISGGREVGGLNAFAMALASGFEELGIEAEVAPLKKILKTHRKDLRDEGVLKIFSTTAVFFVPFCKNVIAVAHGFPRLDAQGFLKWIAILLSFRLSARYAILSCVSNYVKLHLKAFFNIETDGVIFNAVLPKFLEDYKQGQDKKYITYIGRLHKVKNVVVFLEPLKRLLSKYPEFTVQIIGHGTDEELIKNIVKENDRFLVLPPKDPQDVIGVLRESEVFFSGCETEALGISYIEALTQGAKVVMPSSGGGLEIAPKLIGKRIFLFDLSMDEECVFEALEAAVLSKNKESFDSTPFAPKTIAMQYLQLSETKKVK